MISMKNNILGIICTFLFAIIVCGAVSATTTTNFSSDGKVINITHSYVPSTLKTSITTTTKTGTYGNGKYTTVILSGKDNKGRNTNDTTLIYNGVVKSTTIKISSSDGFSLNEKASFGTNSIVIILSGKLNSTVTFSGNETGPITYSNGQPILKTGVGIIKYYVGGKIYATSKITEVCTYKNFNGNYLMVNDTDTTNTLYANGNTRKSVMTTINSINSSGTQIGMKISGTSSGTEKINNKIVTYTGKISIGTKYDPKDLNKYNMGDYKEILTSSSSTLLKIVPFESIDNS